MRAQRIWKAVGADHHTEIAHLQLELAAFNKRISELERSHPERETIDTLKAAALALARRIDEVRCLVATDQLVGLLVK
jgi:uncharacterized protein YydD (DUF2326 family)